MGTKLRPRSFVWLRDAERRIQTVVRRAASPMVIGFPVRGGPKETQFNHLFEDDRGCVLTGVFCEKLKL